MVNHSVVELTERLRDNCEQSPWDFALGGGKLIYMQLAIRCLWPPQTSEEYPTFLPLPIPANLLYIRHAASKITEGSDWLRAHRCQSRQRETCSCQSAACNFPGKGECGLWEGLNNDAVPAPCQERRATPPRPSCSLLPLHKAPTEAALFIR